MDEQWKTAEAKSAAGGAREIVREAKIALADVVQASRRLETGDVPTAESRLGNAQAALRKILHLAGRL